MDLFTYLMAKNGHNSSVHGDLFSYLLGKGQSQIYTVSGVTIYIPNAKKLVSFMMTKESTQANTSGNNLFDKTQIEIGKTWYGSDNLKRARFYIEYTPNQYYTIVTKSLPSGIITCGVIESSSLTSTGGNKYFTNELGNIFEHEFNSAARYLILQFETTNDFTQEDADAIDIDLRVGAAPSPSYPQEVKVVKGYRNLFDKDNLTYIDKCNITSNGVLGTDNNFAVIYTYIQKGTYTISNLDLPAQQWLISDIATLPQKGSQANPRLVVNNVQQVNYTLQEDGYILIRVPLATYNVEEFIEKLQIESGEDAHNYVPYGNNYILYKQVGKNLFDKDKTIKGYYNSSGEFANSTVWNYFEYRPVKNTNYVLSGLSTLAASVNIVGFDENDNVSIISPINNNIKLFNSLNYTKIGYSIHNNDLETAQLEEGSTATSYEPYKETIVPLPLNGNEIVGIGDYKDELKVDKSGHCWLNKKTGKVVLNGSENWEDRPNYTYADRFLFGITTIPIQSAKCFSNYFKVENSPVTDFPVLILNNGQQLIINFSEKGTTTLSQFKVWLSTHNTEVYYASRKPQLIDLNTTVDLKLFKGANTITNSEDGYMTIEYR